MLLKRTVNNINLMKDTFKSAFNMGKNGGITNNFEEIGVINGYNIYLSNEILRSSGCIIACAMKLTTGESVIIVDDIYLRLPEEAQSFIILHELGHIKNSHLENGNTIFENDRIRKKKIKKDNKVCEDELQADMFAYEILGAEKCIEGLIQVRDQYFNYTSNVKELELRIKNLNLYL